MNVKKEFFVEMLNLKSLRVLCKEKLLWTHKGCLKVLDVEKKHLKKEEDRNKEKKKEKEVKIIQIILSQSYFETFYIMERMFLLL